MKTTSDITQDITLTYNSETQIVLVVSGDKTTGTPGLKACAFSDPCGDEVALTVAGVHDGGQDETTITVTFPASGVGTSGNYSITYDDGVGVEFLQVGTYVRDELLKNCAE